MDAADALNSVNALTQQLLSVEMIRQQAQNAALIANMLQSVAEQGKAQGQTDTITISAQAVALSRANTGG